MKTRIFMACLVIVLIVGCTSPAAKQEGVDVGTLNTFETELEGLCQEIKIPGMSAAVVFLTLSRIPSIFQKETYMATQYPPDVNIPGLQTSFPPSDSVDECIARVEGGLVGMDENAQPQWGSAFKLAERMEFYHMMYRHTTPACHWYVWSIKMNLIRRKSCVNS